MVRCKFGLCCWNIRGFVANKDSLTQICRDFFPDMVLFQETFLKTDVTLTGYNVHQKNIHLVHGGGLLIAIKKDLQAQNVTMHETEFGPMEVQAVRIVKEKSNYTILNIYKKPGTFADSELELPRCHISTKAIICGDFNSKLQGMANTLNSPNGSRIRSWAHDNNLVF